MLAAKELRDWWIYHEMHRSTSAAPTPAFYSSILPCVKTLSNIVISIFMSEDKLSLCSRGLKGHERDEASGLLVLKLGHLGRGYLHLVLHTIFLCSKGWLNTGYWQWAYGPIWYVSLVRESLQSSINKWHHIITHVVIAAALWKVNKGVKQLANLPWRTIRD